MSLDENQRRRLVVIAGGITAIAAGAAVLAYASCFEKIAQHTSILTGQQWVDELCEGHPDRFKNEMGINKKVFNKLLRALEEHGKLKDTQYVSAEEQLAIFLHFVLRALSNRGLQERFQCGPETISK